MAKEIHYSNDARKSLFDGVTKLNDAAEGGANPRFEITLDNAFENDIVVKYQLSGSASEGSDYSGMTGQVTFAAGSTSMIIELPLINDSLIEGSETVTATLNGAQTTEGDAIGTITATDDATASIADDDTGNMFVTLSKIQDGLEGGQDGIVRLEFVAGKTGVPTGVPTEDSSPIIPLKHWKYIIPK